MTLSAAQGCHIFPCVLYKAPVMKTHERLWQCESPAEACVYVVVWGIMGWQRGG